MIVDIFSIVILTLTFAGFSARRLLTYLHAFQQEEYDGKRLMRWIFSKNVLDRKLSLILLVTTGLWFFLPHFLVNLMVLLGCAIVTYLEPNPSKNAKKKLAMTDRANRIFISAMVLTGGLLVAIAALTVWLGGIPIFWIVPVQLLPFLLVFGNDILQPFENAVQKKYWFEAHEKVRALNPVIIGITGSFGKTSVKHILGHILNTVAPTLVTPGSVNTPMGVARIIREQLDETHKYMIVEMGAYGPGSIKRLCQLTPPDHGILTAIGHAHYERFKSLDVVAQTKFELAQAVIEKEGKIIANEKSFKFEAGVALQNSNFDSFLTFGDEPTSGATIQSVQQTIKGLEIKLSYQETSHLLTVPLFGTHHAENIVMAYLMARHLGIEPGTIEASLKSLPQIPHRLEVKKNSKGGIIIDDAYNSNPPGFSSALDLLDFVGLKNRTVLITPGMVELGTAHDEVHRKIGGYAATKCDICIVIQPGRIPTFIEGFKKAETPAEIITMDRFDQAQKWLSDNMTENDVVLLENDLPDVYERVPKL